MTAPDPWRLRISSDPVHLAGVRREMESYAQACGFDHQVRGQIVLCVNEALANITRHAYQGAKDRPVELTATFQNHVLTIELRDWGSGKIPQRPPVKADPLSPGGVGMICLRELMDEISFSPQSDGMILTMRRRMK